MTERRSGVTLVEVVVVVLLVGFILLVLAAFLPRGRERARLASCQNNLMRIGRALALYDRAGGALPFILPPGGDSGDGPGPLFQAIQVLGVSDFAALPSADGTGKPIAAGPVPTAGRVGGFLCPSDNHASSPLHPSPVSYRACAGDAPDGRNGAFAPGRAGSMAGVEEGDGRSYTAAFSERLLGTGEDGRINPLNYATAPFRPEILACPDRPAEFWRGDAGSSWVGADWRSTLYNHALPPNASPSCVSDDGRSAFMGASSAHADGVNVLMLDGSVRTVRPTVAPPVWKALATVRSSPPAPAPVGPAPGVGIEE